ncbi:MAG: energy transducer TonB [Xanthomonadales bacterium]|nr:energy transducer TonB [Xanthomonadales bacterium]
MGFAGAFHLAAFMVVMAPSAPVDAPPARDRTFVLDVQDVKPKPKPPVMVPMPTAPVLSQPQEPRPQPPQVEREVVVQAPPVLTDSPYDMAYEAIETASSPDPLARVSEIGPSVQQSYGHITNVDYPRRAREKRLEGDVMLRILVDVTGDPLEVQVESSSGHRVLDVAALKAVRKWKFNPGLSNGQPIQGWVLVPINFSLK